MNKVKKKSHITFLSTTQSQNPKVQNETQKSCQKTFVKIAAHIQTNFIFNFFIYIYEKFEVNHQKISKQITRITHRNYEHELW